MRYRYQHRDQVFEINLERQGESYRATIDGYPYAVEVLDVSSGQISLLFAGQPVTLYWAGDGGTRWISLDGCSYRLEKPARRVGSQGEGGGKGSRVRAPMPAQVREVHVASGETVEQGQTLLILEAMKMEIRVQAPQAGVVTRLAVTEGEQVERDQLLAEVQ